MSRDFLVRAGLVLTFVKSIAVSETGDDVAEADAFEIGVSGRDGSSLRIVLIGILILKNVIPESRSSKPRFKLRGFDKCPDDN